MDDGGGAVTTARYGGNTRAFLKIQDGCDSSCSYCVIPLVRGAPHSKPLDEVVREAETLVRAGCKEIVLVGINLSLYGREYGLRTADAVEAVCEAGGVSRVRLGSVEPEALAGGAVERLSRLEKFCPHFHISLQSGCEKTLKAMNRRYTPDEYERLVKEVRTNFENCAVTTDVIVGFPGETDADFRDSLEFVRRAGFSKVHVFPYSKRDGTAAAARTDEQIPRGVIKDRAARMADAANEARREFLESQLGLEVPVLFECEKGGGFPQGYSPNYTLIKILQNNFNNSLRNKIIYVKIVKAEQDCCIGRII
jgi:threonylcarbamoyladenosine tRNA methylthiotransferase MtaB